MKLSLKYILISISLVCIIINGSCKDKTQGKPLKYCYENFRKLDHDNAVLVLTDIKYKTEYLKYYTDVENGEEPLLDNKLEFLFLPQNEPVYLLSVSEDSMLAKVVYNGAYNKFTPSHIQGYVYYKTLHDSLPAK